METSALLWTFSAEFYLRYLLFSPDGKFVAASHKQGIIGPETHPPALCRGVLRPRGADPPYGFQSG